MPTYEYECEACGHKFEKFHSITAPPIRKCPKCAKNKVKRLIGTGAGLIFKGSGFYITDYRSEGYKSDQKSDTAPTPAASTDAKPSQTKPDTSKPAAASDAKPAAAPKPADPKPSTPVASKSTSKRKR